jgi:glycosyltransferase involved in cell wall biosynthesis
MYHQDEQIIIHITNGLFRGGVGAVIKNLLLEQDKLGFQTAILTADNEYSVYDWIIKNNLKTIPFFVEERRKKFLTIKGCLSKSNYKKIVEVFKDKTIIFHYHNTIAIGLFSHLKKQSIKFCTLHGELYSKKKFSKSIALLTLKRFIRKKGDLIGCCEHIANYYKATLKIKNHISHALNGVSIEEKEENKYLFNVQKKHIGFVGFLDELKGWDYLVNAFLSLPKAIREKVDLTFIGGVMPEARENFKNILKENQDIRYLGVLKDVTTCVMPYLDILVLPSRTEGMPMVILEAMQAGVVCLATAVGGIPELIKDNETGMIITRNVDDIRAKLEKVITDEQLRKELSQNAKKLFLEKGTAKAMNDRYLEIYQLSLKDNK